MVVSHHRYDLRPIVALPRMRKLVWLLLLIPLTVTGAVQRFRMEWSALPAEQVVHGECLINNTWTEVGTAPGNGSITFEMTGSSGEQRPCRAYTTLTGLPDSPRSEVAVAVFPLDAPIIRVVPI